MDTTCITTPTPKTTVPAPPGTTPNKLVKSYPPGRVVAPSSIPASQTGHKNVGQDMRQYQVPQ